MSKRDQFEADLSDKAGLAATWRGLMEHPGWKLLEVALKEQRQARLLTLAEPCSGFGSVLPQEFMKGETSGLGLAMTFPTLQIELLESEVKRLNVLIEQEKEYETQASSAVSRGRVDNDGDWERSSGLEHDSGRGGYAGSSNPSSGGD